MRHIAIQHADFDTGAEARKITQGRHDIGAVVTFTGLCRDENGRLAALELEHYPGMAEEEIGRVADEAGRRWPLSGLIIIHRFGKILPGEQIVLVVTASSHRAAALEAADFMMDFLKTRAPFWKKEHGCDGGSNDWVDAREIDDAAAAWANGVLSVQGTPTAASLHRG